jgi:hypothetical protein
MNLNKIIVIPVLAVVLLPTSCRVITGESVDSTTLDTTSIPVLQPVAGDNIYRSDQNYLTVDLPYGWEAAEGPRYLAHPFEGEVAFNSWGEEGFWTPEIRSGNSFTYSPETVVSQVPGGGAYVALVRIGGPPIVNPDSYPTEYALNDLSGLMQPHDWRENSGTSAYFREFYKWGRSLRLEIACRPDASDDTVNALNDLLQSWRFDALPAGDAGWAFTVARQLLPEEVVPLRFRDQSSMSHDQSVARKSEVEVGPDKTVHFRFTYFWDLPSSPDTGDFDNPSDTFHWWEIDVLPPGEAILSAQGGVPLPAAQAGS